ncbi:sensor histidine kinase [Parachryseolinea silvisoli]|uniref:sensor histidine kinase n=1 Tax=Parachryseolinea silvisoli TaxID=2873601 RepID=UPI002265AAA7|nr:sensor histidine kinase [Parachryseolinea silvisoli]MCD9015763.1 sensor histidine kinase [Parachryseolinea silvisoli]
MTQQHSLFCRYFVVCVLVTLFRQGYAQIPTNPLPKGYDLVMTRMLLNATGNYIHAVTQGQLDMDSAKAYACHIYQLNRLLPYSAGYSNQWETPGSRLLQAGKVGEAERMLGTAAGEARLQLLTELGSYYLFKPGNDSTDLSHAEHFIRRLHTEATPAFPEKWKNESLLLLGKLYAQRGALPESQQYFEEAVQTVRTIRDGVTLADNLYAKAMGLPITHPAKLPLLEEALSLSQKHARHFLEAEIKGAIGTEHFFTNPREAEKDMLDLLEVHTKLGYQHLQYVHNTLAYIYSRTSDNVKARYHAEQSLKFMAKTHDAALACIFYQRMAEAHGQTSNIKEALYWNERALKELRTKENQIFWYKSFFARGNWLVRTREFTAALQLIEEVVTSFPPGSTFDKMHLALLLGNTYAGLKRFAEAEQQYLQFTVMAERFPPAYVYSELPDAYLWIAIFYFNRQQYARSHLYIDKAMPFVEKKGAVQALANLHLLSAKLDSVEGHYLSAIKHYRQHSVFRDSVYSITQRNKIAELEVRYESARKDQDIQLLTERNQQAAFVRNITLAGVVLLLIILGLLYYLYRAKLRSNAQLQSKQLEISQKNRTLQRLLDEKEWLVKEIHHRVKNNLHTIVSLLESQSAYLGNDALAAVRDSQHRVFAMSLIHQKLYLSDNVTTIDMSIYIKELVNYLGDSFDIAQRIRFELDIEPIKLDVGMAIPLGLVMNEAITNSIKYAFPQNAGVITISLKEDDVRCRLIISDNGSGLPVDFDNVNASSLGMRLMRGLSKEIDATFTIAGHAGTIITITFADNTLLHAIRDGHAAEPVEMIV